MLETKRVILRSFIISRQNTKYNQEKVHRTSIGTVATRIAMARSSHSTRIILLSTIFVSTVLGFLPVKLSTRISYNLYS